MALYLIQEGRAQVSQPNLVFFVDFPTGLLPLAYAALALLLVALAYIVIVSVRGFRIGAWAVIASIIGATLLGVLVGIIGPDGVRTIIDPTGTN